MNIFFIYLLKVNIALSIVFIIYLVLFKNNTLFRSKRIFLLSVCAFTLIYPFVSVPIENSTPFLQNISYYYVEEGLYSDDVSTLNSGEVSKNTFEINLPTTILLLYLTVILILTTRFIIQGIGLFKLIRSRKPIQLIGHKVIVLSKKTAPFSFFSWIVIDQETSQESDLHEILIHEQAHADQRHSIDVIFSEIYTILCWFNPLAWFIRKEIRLNLEYLADASVIRSGYNPEQYQFHILRLSYPIAIAQLYTGFNFSPLKKRIKMMNTKKSSTKAYLKYLLFVPVIGSLLLINQKKMEAMPSISDMSAIPEMLITATENPTPKPVTQAPAKKQQNPEQEKVHEHVDKMPKYPGGDAEFLKFVQRNLLYPVKAQENDIQGTVRIRFTVKKDGSIGDIQVLRSVNSECDKAAIEAIKLSPKWTPGELNGKPVNVWYNVPVRFELTGHDAVSKKEGKTPAKDNNTSKKTYVVRMLEMDANGIYLHAEQSPKFPGGDTEFLKFVQSNLLYPVKAQEAGNQGTVRLRFIVKKDGSIGDIQVLRGISPECDKAAIDAIKKTSQKWTPGRAKGEPVDVWYNVPVKFVLEDGKTPAQQPNNEKTEVIFIEQE